MVTPLCPVPLAAPSSSCVRAFILATRTMRRASSPPGDHTSSDVASSPGDSPCGELSHHLRSGSFPGVTLLRCGSYSMDSRVGLGTEQGKPPRLRAGGHEVCLLPEARGPIDPEAGDLSPQWPMPCCGGYGITGPHGSPRTILLPQCFRRWCRWLPRLWATSEAGVRYWDLVNAFRSPPSLQCWGNEATMPHGVADILVINL